MKRSLRMRFGLWIERYAVLHPLLLVFSHEHPEGHSHYLNRISRTFAKKR